MRRFLGPIAAASIFIGTAANAAAQPSSSSQPADAAKLAEAHSIIAVMFPESQRDSMYRKLQANLLKQMLPPREKWMEQSGIKEIFDEFIADASAKQRVILEKYLPLQMDAMASAYTRMFTLTELKDIDSFAHTPSGRHYLLESTAIIGDPDVAKVNTALAADVRAATDGMMPAFKEKLVAYVTSHPEIAAEIKAEDKSQ